MQANRFAQNQTAIKTQLNKTATTTTTTNHRILAASASNSLVVDKNEIGSKMQTEHNQTQQQQMHVCRLCDKLLSSSSSLDRHMLTHSGERPFVCKRCHMTFTTNGNMHRHMRTHLHKDSLARQQQEQMQLKQSLFGVAAAAAAAAANNLQRDDNACNAGDQHQQPPSNNHHNLRQPKRNEANGSAFDGTSGCGNNNNNSSSPINHNTKQQPVTNQNSLPRSALAATSSRRASTSSPLLVDPIHLASLAAGLSSQSQQRPPVLAAMHHLSNSGDSAAATSSGPGQFANALGPLLMNQQLLAALRQQQLTEQQQVINKHISATNNHQASHQQQQQTTLDQIQSLSNFSVPHSHTSNQLESVRAVMLAAAAAATAATNTINNNINNDQLQLTTTRPEEEPTDSFGQTLGSLAQSENRIGGKRRKQVRPRSHRQRDYDNNNDQSAYNFGRGSTSPTSNLIGADDNDQDDERSSNQSDEMDPTGLNKVAQDQDYNNNQQQTSETNGSGLKIEIEEDVGEDDDDERIDGQTTPTGSLAMKKLSHKQQVSMDDATNEMLLRQVGDQLRRRQQAAIGTNGEQHRNASTSDFESVFNMKLSEDNNDDHYDEEEADDERRSEFNLNNCSSSSALSRLSQNLNNSLANQDQDLGPVYGQNTNATALDAIHHQKTEEIRTQDHSTTSQDGASDDDDFDDQRFISMRSSNSNNNNNSNRTDTNSRDDEDDRYGEMMDEVDEETSRHSTSGSPPASLVGPITTVNGEIIEDISQSYVKTANPNAAKKGGKRNRHCYKCKLCTYSSVDRCTLVRHLRIHSGERPYICGICRYAFTTKANCERHVRKRHKKQYNSLGGSGGAKGSNGGGRSLIITDHSNHQTIPVKVNPVAAQTISQTLQRIQEKEMMEQQNPMPSTGNNNQDQATNLPLGRTTADANNNNNSNNVKHSNHQQKRPFPNNTIDGSGAKRKQRFQEHQRQQHQHQQSSSLLNEDLPAYQRRRSLLNEKHTNGADNILSLFGQHLFDSSALPSGDGSMVRLNGRANKQQDLSNADLSSTVGDTGCNPLDVATTLQQQLPDQSMNNATNELFASLMARLQQQVAAAAIAAATNNDSFGTDASRSDESPNQANVGHQVNKDNNSLLLIKNNTHLQNVAGGNSNQQQTLGSLAASLRQHHININDHNHHRHQFNHLNQLPNALNGDNGQQISSATFLANMLAAQALDLSNSGATTNRNW